MIRSLKIFLLLEWSASALVAISLASLSPDTAFVVFAVGSSVVPIYICHFVTGILLGQLKSNGMPILVSLQKSWWFNNFTLIHPRYLKWIYGFSEEPKYFSEDMVLRICSLSHRLGFIGLFITLIAVNVT